MWYTLLHCAISTLYNPMIITLLCVVKDHKSRITYIIIIIAIIQ